MVLQTKKIANNPFLALIVAFIAFSIAFSVIYPIKFQEMGTGDYWIEQVFPISYWIATITILVVAYLLINRLAEKRVRTIFIALSILLMISIRMVFAITFTSVPIYEPDTSSYMTAVSTWATQGLNFGIPGLYQHDYPLSFLLGYLFVKLGLTVDLYFRIAPIVIDAIEIVLVYLIIREVVPNDRKYAAFSVLLLAISPMSAWATIHYCPDLMGTLFFMVSLLLTIRFAKKGEWSLKAVLPVTISVILLILSHHLSTVYFIVTLLGLALATLFFRNPEIKGKALSFFLIAIFTYTFWFVYGSYEYPNFFNVYVYFSGFGSITAQATQTPLLINAEYALYPAFILVLSLFGLFQLFKISKVRELMHIRSKLRQVKGENGNLLMVYSVGFVLILFLFILGLAVPVIFAPRVLEVLLLGLYPVASLFIFKLMETNPSRKKTILLLVLLIFITIISIHRYYNAMQRRVNIET
jgi:hypothetical protein